MRVISNGIGINCELSGNKESPVVMLSHSLASSIVMWAPQMELGSRFRLLRYDVRGHGGSDVPGGMYTMDELGDDALGLLDALDIEAVHFVGLSMGGMIGQNLALRYPGRLRSLVLCDTAAEVPQSAQPVWQDRIGRAQEGGMEALVQETLERWFTPAYLRENPPEVQSIRKQILSTPVNGFIGCCGAIRSLNYLERLKEIHLPTLIIVGEEDPGTPVSAAEAMHERIPNSRLKVIPSAAHLSNVEQPEAFNNALGEILQA